MAAEGAVSGIWTVESEGLPRDEIVRVERFGTVTLLLFEDGSRLEVQTGELLRELLDAQIIAELVARVVGHAQEIEGAA